MRIDSFRRMVRVPETQNKDDIEYWLIERLKQLESESPYRLQEWMRNAMRNEFMREIAARNVLDTSNEAVLQQLRLMESKA